ncbi:MAG: serine/threonine protein kinase [Methanobrevibacter sp.]|nr:serine/threonine protein kinase [Methanobrevibacter sp.]
MSEERILKTGKILNRKYKIEKFLGGGAFGEVYRVKNTFLKKRFAIKVFKVALEVKGSESTVQELLDEAVLLAKFDHRNIVKVHDADVFIGDDGQEHVFFVMDYIPGGDLDDYWKSFGARFVPLENVIDIIKQICLGLNVLHSEKPPMIHRDIKPQNIMIGYDNHGVVAKLTDFGLVKTVNPSTLYASAKGTLAFKAPEFLEEKDDTSTDIFALGVTFYMLLTDKFPYPIDSDFDVMTGSWLKKKPKPLNYYNPLIRDEKLEKMVFTAIETDSKKRYQNAQELLDAIEDWEKNKDIDVVEEEIPDAVPEDEKPADEHQKTSEKQSVDDADAQYIHQKAERQAENAKEMAKDPKKFMYASDAFAYAFKNDNEVRDKHQDNLNILNSSKPVERFIEGAMKAVNNLLDYEKGVDYFEQAFAQRPELKEKYNSRYELWKSFVLIRDSQRVDEGISALRQLAGNDPAIDREYGFCLDLLASKDAKKMESEALKYVDRFEPVKASRIMELAMLLDDSIRDRYQYKLRTWKKGIIN